MADLITNVTSVVTAGIGWLGDFSEAIVGDPVLVLMVVAIPLVGLGVGLLKRMISL